MRKGCVLISAFILLSLLTSCRKAEPAQSTVADVPETATPNVTVTPVPSPAPTDTPYEQTVLYATDGSSRLCLTLTGPQTAVLSERDSFVALSYDLSGDVYSFTGESSNNVLFTGSFKDDIFCLNDSAGYYLSFSEDPSAISSAGRIKSSPDGTGLSVTDLFIKDGVVSITFNGEAGCICFSAINSAPDADSPDWIACNSDEFRIFKSDGEYYLYYTDQNSQIFGPVACSVDTGRSYNKGSPLRLPVADILTENGDSLENVNRRLADLVTDAGIYSRAGVASAASYLVSLLSSYDSAVPYQGHGRYAEQDVWGIPSVWGSKLTKADRDLNGTYNYAGLHCAASTVWAYKQACLNLVSTRQNLALYGFGRHSANYKDNIIPRNRCQAGDVLKTTTTHTMMVVDRLDTDKDGCDDSYLILEMVNPIMTLSVKSFSSIRACTAYDMSAVFEDTGAERKFLAYWPDSFYIPEAEWPEYLRESNRMSPVRLSLSHIKDVAGL